VKHINILFIVQNEPFYIPKMMEYFIKNYVPNISICGITILPPHRKNRNYLDWFKERARIYTLFELIIVGFLFVYAKINSLLFRRSPYTLEYLTSKYRIPVIPTNDINSVEYVNTILSLGVDCIISISCPQLFKNEILSSCKYNINAHGTLLPRHRGVFGSWWTLFSCDKYGGSTIHTMELKLDAGQILWQKEFKLEKRDTQFSVAYKAKHDMAVGLVEVISQILEDRLKGMKSNYETSYHRAPTRKEGNQFRKKGLKIIGFKDIRNVLAGHF
jgi:methionyl-tRNA formyltransferase